MTQAPTNLPPALPGERRALHTDAGAVSYYVQGDTAPGRPLLLVHSVNAAASAYEVKPIYERYSGQRPTYAIDLPGYGFSERAERRYTPRLMTEAIHALLAEIAARHGGVPVDALAVSLGCEFLARAAAERPAAFRSLALVSPTGFSRSTPDDGQPGSTRGNALLYRAFTVPLWSRAFFAALTSRPSIRYFLRKTFGSKQIDEGLADYDYLTTHQPGARHAPYDFVSGFLFSGDIRPIYRSLALPVLMVHGTRGDFTDYSRKDEMAQKPNWSIRVLETGALPYFERPAEFLDLYDAFLGEVAGKTGPQEVSASAALRTVPGG